MAAQRGVLLADDGLGPGRDLSFDDITVVAATVASGGGGVMFVPWLNGERSPVADAALRASFLNLGSSRAGPRWCAPCSRAWPTTRCTGCTTHRRRC